LLAKPGGCATRAARSDSARRLPPAWLCYSAAEEGSQFKTILTLTSPWRRGDGVRSCGYDGGIVVVL